MHDTDHSPALRPGPELRRHNDPILAERLRWPGVKLRACRYLERRHPGWVFSWLGENTIKGFERPAGYWGVRNGMHAAEVFAPTIQAIEEMILAAPPPEHDPNEYCPYCVTPRPFRAGWPERSRR